MNIVILGAGSIGSHLAVVLSEEGHNVIVIDQDHKALEKVARAADIATRQGSGTDWEVLEEIKDFSPDFFIAMSSDDETNLIACAIAKNLGYPKTAARIRQNCFLEAGPLNFNRLFAVDHILGTELIIAQDIVKCIVSHLAIENFAHGAVQMRTLVIPESFKSRPLAAMRLDDILVGVIRRGDKTIFPKGRDYLLPGDEVAFVGKAAAMPQLADHFKIQKKTVRSATIVGGSGVAIHIAQLLTEQRIKMRIIEQNDKKCAELARLFPDAVIINHEGTDWHFLKEERVALSDVFIACTEVPETNILAALLGKEAGCPEVIAVVSDESVISLLERFQISYALSEQACITRRVHLIVHDDSLLSLASLYEAHFFEARLAETSPLLGIPLADLALPDDFLIAMVKTEKGIIIPSGNTILSPNDTVIIISSIQPHELRKILS